MFHLQCCLPHTTTLLPPDKYVLVSFFFYSPKITFSFITRGLCHHSPLQRLTHCFPSFLGFPFGHHSRFNCRSSRRVDNLLRLYRFKTASLYHIYLHVINGLFVEPYIVLVVDRCAFIDIKVLC